jgi:hypothetical protein
MVAASSRRSSITNLITNLKLKRIRMRDHIWLFFICTAITLGLLGIPCHAQQEEDLSYQKMSGTFFKMLQQGQGAEGIDYLLGTNPAMKKVPDKVEHLKSEFASLGTLMGPYISHTKLAETKVAGMFVYQHYFVAYERQPISIRIKYYKPGSTWLCYAVQFDAELDELIQKETDDRIPIDVK